MSVSKITSAPSENEVVGKINEIIDNLGGTVDQTYNAISTNAQSGTAVANALATLATVASSGSYNDLTNKPIIPTVTSIYTASGTDAVNGIAVSNAIATKQDTLVSGTTIKTLNGASLLGSGNITIEASSTPDVDEETISYNSSTELQTIGVINQRNGSAIKLWHGTEAQWNQGDPTPWYYWQTNAAISNQWTNPVLNYRPWYYVAYGNNVYLAVGWEKLARSTDGETWEELTRPFSSSGMFGIAYGAGKFVILSKAGFAYSTDNGDSWTEIPDSRLTSGNNALYSQLSYVGNYFIALSDNDYMAVSANPSKVLFSSDGITWNESNSTSGIGVSVASDGNIYVLLTGLNTISYSYDLLNWTSKTITNANSFRDIAFGNGTFVISVGGKGNGDYNTQFLYSFNGIDWNTATSMRSLYLSSTSDTYFLISYCSNKFIAFPKSKKLLVSNDGINWTIQETLSSAINFQNTCAGNKKLVTVVQSNNCFYITSFDSLSCFTDSQTPTTSSTVYSAPETTSALTISSVTSGAITLSDNNTYYYNQSGNQYTYQSVGESHPDWLCFIDGVGVKIGTTTIATNYVGE